MKRVLYICLCLIAGSCMLAAGRANSRRAIAPSAADSALHDYFYMEGEKQSILGNHEAAFALIQEAVRLNPGSLQARYGLAKSFLRINQVDTALALLRQVANSDTTHLWYNIGYANTAAHLREYDEARMALERIARNHRGKPEIYDPLASLYIQSKEYDKALACYDTLERYIGNSPELAANRVGLYDMMGDTATAISIAEELAAKKPTDIYILLYLNDVYRYYKRHAKQMDVINRVQELAPDEPIAYIEKANIYLTQGDTVAHHNEYNKLLRNENIEYDTKLKIIKDYIPSVIRWEDTSAITTAYTILIDLYPYETTARKEYVNLLIYLQEYDLATEQLKKLIEQSDEVEYWENLTLSYFYQKLYTDATMAGQKAIEKGSRNFLAYLFISNISSNNKEYEQAAEYLHKALQVCSEEQKYERSLLHGSLGDIYHLQGRMEECFQQYDTALVYNPKNAMALNNYAYNLACNGGDLLKAEQMSASALKLEPDNKTFIDTYAWILFKMESYTLARIYMEQVIKEIKPEDEGSNVYYEHYGDILALSGEIDTAIAQWEKSYEIEPTPLLKKKIEQKQYIEK